MKRVYVEPKMEMEEFGAEQAVMAGNCVPGVDEKKEIKNVKVLECQYHNAGGKEKCSITTTIFIQGLDCAIKLEEQDDTGDVSVLFGEIVQHTVPGGNGTEKKKTQHLAVYKDLVNGKPHYFQS